MSKRPALAGCTLPAQSEPASADLENTPLDPSSPEDARLSEVLRLVMQGKTQREIGRKFRATDRTVRRWLTEARRRRLATFRHTDPEEVLARADHVHAILEMALLDRLARAQRRGDDKAIEAASRELRGLQRDRIAVREMVGFFDGWRFDHGTKDDPHAEEARIIVDVIGKMVRGDFDAILSDNGRR